MRRIIITEEQYDLLTETMSEMRVRHMPNSSKYKPKKYNSWKEFWKDKTTSKMPFPENGVFKCDCCQKYRNTEKNEEKFVGGHVISENNKAFVYPICEQCNSKAKNDNDFSQKLFKARLEWLVPFSHEDAVDNEENQKE